MLAFLPSESSLSTQLLLPSLPAPGIVSTTQMGRHSSTLAFFAKKSHTSPS